MLCVCLRTGPSPAPDIFGVQLRSFVKEAAKTAQVSIFVLSSSVSQNVPLCILCVACFAFLPGWFDVYYLDGVMM